MTSLAYFRHMEMIFAGFSSCIRDPEAGYEGAKKHEMHTTRLPEWVTLETKKPPTTPYLHESCRFPTEVEVCHLRIRRPLELQI